MKTRPEFAKLLRPRNGERGATMILVAVGLSFMILAMAALAIDLVALYSARNDARLAADAAALAGAKTIANSGYTTDQTTIQWSTIRTVARDVGKAVAAQNKIGNQAIPTAKVTVQSSNNANDASVTSPQVTVTVTANNVPAFFSRIWGNKALSIEATATAEAYNPSGNTLPVQSQCVKPWLLPNLNLSGSVGSMFDKGTGALLPGQTVGTTYTLLASCPNGCGALLTITPAAASYIPAQLTAPSASGVPACAPDACTYEQNISVCSPQPVSCSSGSSIQQVSIDTGSCGGGAGVYNGYTYTGTSCLIHASGTGLGTGQDCMGTNSGSCGGAASTIPTQIFAGTNNRFIADGINVGDLISTSDSLVTIPVFDYNGGSIPIATPVNVIGFVQGFITSVDNVGNITIKLVNISGCGSGVTGSPVQGDGISPVPVHLIGN